MALKPPSLRIEKRGRQHRVYWRKHARARPARPVLPGRFYSSRDAEPFIGMAGFLGLEIARQVMAAEDVAARRALLETALTERGLAPRPRPRGAGSW